jgi:hypothetical protein
MAQAPKKLLEQMRDGLRLKHYALRTETTSLAWARLSILFHGKHHPATLGTDRHSKRHVYAGTSEGRPLEPPSATRRRTRLAWGVHAHALRGAAAPTGVHRGKGWGSVARLPLGLDTRRRTGCGFCREPCGAFYL